MERYRWSYLLAALLLGAAAVILFFTTLLIPPGAQAQIIDQQSFNKNAALDSWFRAAGAGQNQDPAVMAAPTSLNHERLWPDPHLFGQELIYEQSETIRARITAVETFTSAAPQSETPELELSKWTTPGYARPGGVVNYGLHYHNHGDLLAENVIIVDTLPPNTSYASDNSGFPVEIGPNGAVTWTVGAAQPHEGYGFILTLNVAADAPTGESLAPNCAVISTTTPGDDEGNNTVCSGEMEVWEDEVEMGVHAWPNPGDPAPGHEMVYRIEVCNHRGAAAGPVALNNTFPVGISLVSWRHDNPGEVGWQEAPDPPEGVLSLETAGFPGHFCGNIYFRLQLDPALSLGTILANQTVVTVDDDVYLENNEFNADATVSPPRYDVSLSKEFVHGVLAPGGWVRYRIRQENSGNIALQTWITDTLPAGLAYAPGSAGRHDGQPMAEPDIVGPDLIWDLGAAAVADGLGFDFTALITDTASPGAILNCAAAGGATADTNPYNNTSCVESQIFPAGPNLSIRKEHWWNGDGQLGYRLYFYNVGDESVANFSITDTLPANTAWDGWWHMEFDWGRLLTHTLTSDRLIWRFTDLHPGDMGVIQFNANLLEPGLPLRWFTNTVEISPIFGDMNPDDNVYQDVAFSGGEVRHVEMWLGTDHANLWGNAVPGDVTVTTPHTQVTVWADPDCGGCWGTDDLGPLWPGDTVIVNAGGGLQPVTILIPDPLSVYADADTGEVWGQIGGADNHRLEILGNWPNGHRESWTDAAGVYSVVYANIPRAAEGHLRYEQTIDYAPVVFNRRFRAPDLIFTLNYDHDWLETRYDPGHTVWLTVTTGEGVVKTAVALTTDYNPDWGWQSGFNYGLDINPGDFVYGAVDNGYTAALRLGQITGNVDVDADLISGVVDAPWLPAIPVHLECHAWGAPEGAPGKTDTLLTDGVDTYACAWDPDSEWDVQPGQDIGVIYNQLDGHRIMAAFREPVPHTRVETWLDGGYPGAGGHAVFYIQYRNEGGAPAENVVITNTLQGMSYLADTSGLPLTGGSDQIVWHLGTLEPGDWIHFLMFAAVDAAVGETVVQTAEIATTTPYDEGGEWEKYSEWVGEVVASDVQLSVGKGAWTGDPAAGYDVVFHVHICNNGGTGSTEITLTDALNEALTLNDWWSDTPGWNEVSRSDHQLVVSKPVLGPWRCEGVYIRATVDDAAWEGTDLWNQAVIFAANDLSPDDDEAWWHGSVHPPRTDLSVSKWWNWGTLTPGGRMNFNIHYHNHGNIPVPTFRITDTLPAATIFDSAWQHDQFGPQPITPTIMGDGYLVWEFAGLDNGYGGHIELILQILPDALPGTPLVNSVEITCFPDEPCHDNVSVWTDMVFDHGPNLRVTKEHGWHENWRLGYYLQFYNMGDEPVENVWLTDTLPADTHWDGWWEFHFDWGRLITYTLDSHLLNWHIAALNPGERGAIVFNADLDMPGEPMRWYTNTAEIVPLIGDVYPEDNIYHAVAFSGGEVHWVDFDLYRSRVWGCAYDAPVVIATDSTEMTFWDSCWDEYNFPDTFNPGDIITVTAGAGAHPLIVYVPDPFTAHASSITNTVWGQIGGAANHQVEVDLWGFPRKWVTTDSEGYYSVEFNNVPRNAEGDVNYHTQIDYTDVTFHRRFRSPDLTLNINYAHDWVEGNYEPGHTVWITVTDSDGTIKATAEMLTGEIPWWGGNTGFSTNQDDPWQPQRPDIQPGDFVHGAVSTGYAATVEIGYITGLVDADADAITGTVDVPWLMPDPVDIWCHPWGAPGWTPGKGDSVIPDGSDIYSCAWDPLTEWDVQPGQDIAVSYQEPDGHQVYAVFREPVYDLILNIDYYHNWIGGPYEPGYTVWLTVTDSLGEIKAVAKMSTNEHGFSTSDGNPWHPRRPNIEAGDWVYGYASSGYETAVQIGDISGEVDLDGDLIFGTIDAPWLPPDPLAVNCDPRIWPEWAPDKWTTAIPDGNDLYTCAWTEWNILPGQRIFASYREPAGHTIGYIFHSPILEIYYPHDWVEAEYDPGHTVWLTVTNAGGEVKATATMLTQSFDWWDGRTGFSTNWNDPWQPTRPDIQPGDWILVDIDDGWSTAVQIGELTGVVDMDANRLTGTVNAPEMGTYPAYVECRPPHDVTRRALEKYDWIAPDGVDPYLCAWDPDIEWDIQPGETIQVFYRDIAGHKIWNFFYEPRYDLILEVNYGNDNRIVGRYELGYTVWLTVANSSGEIKGTTALTTEYVDPWGATGFSWAPQHFTIRAGDWVYGAVDNGYTAVLQIGQISAFVDINANSIAGTVNAPWLLPEVIDIECHPWIWPQWAPHKYDTLFPDGEDTFNCAWDPDTEWVMQLGQEIGVQYREPNEHRIMRGFPVANYDLLLTVNYDEDWISGPYAANHTVWLTVTDSADQFKASIELYTDWNGFSSHNGMWQPAPPDIEPGDHVYGLVENGRTAVLHVGEIAGVLNIEANSLTGTVNAPWLNPDPGLVEVECYAWDAPDWIAHQFAAVTPDGAEPYVCAWGAGEWNIQPGQTVAAVYHDPGGHQVVRLFSEPLPPPVYDPEAIVVVTEYSAADALARLEAGELSVWAQQTRDLDVVAAVAASPDLDAYRAYGLYNELTFNPAGPIFAGTGKLNPFAVPRIREAMNWLVDRDYIAEVIMGGMAVPRWHALNVASPDYADLADATRSLELAYAYDKQLANQVIEQEMLALGATRTGGKWYHAGQAVEIILLIRIEDERLPIGDYVGDQLEAIGFTVIRDYKSSAEAGPIWISSDPAQGLFHIYTGGWITMQVPRDLAGNFAFFYTDMGLDSPLWHAYQNSPEFYELAGRLNYNDFASLEERRAMMAQALDWALADSVRVWLVDYTSVTPRRAELSYASELYGGIAGSWLWPHTLRATDGLTLPLTIGSPGILYDPWNPLHGSGWIYDGMLIKATSDAALIPDPFTGLPMPQRIVSAAIVAETGLPIFATSDWLDLQFAAAIEIPAGAWAGWDADTQQFRTAADVYGGSETARIKSVVYYSDNLYTAVSWHDGSPISLGDFVLKMILAFERGLMDVKAVRILSENPLIIETYTDYHPLEAESVVITWWPYYDTGPGAWHGLALGLLAEEAGTGAFDQWQANDQGVLWLDYVAWPGILPLELQLAAIETDHIPYAPTLGQYITSGEAAARWTNLTAWHGTCGHLWVGTGPLYLEQVYKPLGQLSLKPFAAYPDDPERWDAYREAPIPAASVSGPTSISKGSAATFDVTLIWQEEPYPVSDIERVSYLLINNRGEIAFTGQATAVQDGLWQIALTGDMTNLLPVGLNRLEIIVTSRRAAIAVFTEWAFATTGLRVHSVTPSSGTNDAATAVVISGQHFQPGAAVTLLKTGVIQPLPASFVSPEIMQATVPAGLPLGNYDLRVVNPDGQVDRLLSAFTILSPTPPEITAVSPEQGLNNIPITLDIHGGNFAAGLSAALSDGDAVYPLVGLYVINSSHLRADVSAGIPPGLYTLTITNPNGLAAQLPAAYEALEQIDDLYPQANSFWLNPLTIRQGASVTPTMGIFVRRLGGEAELPAVPVAFYYQIGDGDPILIGAVNTPPLAPDSQAATPPLLWNSLPVAGTYTLRAVIDPDNTIPETAEGNNSISREVIILPPLPDTTPPIVQSFTINDGATQTTNRQVSFNAVAQDNPGGSGVVSLLYVEYVYIYSRSAWEPVASSGWLPYGHASQNYPWLLNPVPGIHYVRAWAADAAGNISPYWRSAAINLMPTHTAAGIATSQIHTYRFYLQAGQGLALTLTSETGDADVYVFGPDNSLITYSFSDQPVEGTEFIAASNGVYQIEVFGFMASNYRLQIGPYSGGLLAPLQVQELESKTPRTEPLIGSDNSPNDDEPVQVPSAPAYPSLLPAFTIGKSYGGSPIAGLPITYTLMITNVGDALGTGLLITDALPANVSYASGGDFDPVAGVVSWQLAGLLPGEAAQLQFVVLLGHSGLVINDQYRVAASNEGVVSDWGEAVSFAILPPTIEVGFSQSATEILVTGSVAFTDTSMTNGAPIATWLWEFGDGGTSDQQYPSHAYNSDGFFTVRLTVTDGLGYSAVATSTVTVNPPALIANFEQSATEVVVGATVVFTDISTTNLPPTVAWFWEFGDGGISDQQHPSHAYSSDGLFIIRLTVTDTLGYSAATTSTVTVNAPDLVANFDQSAEVIVVGSTVTFTNTSATNGPAIAAWLWDFGDGQTSTAQNPIHLYTAAGVYTVSLQVTDSLGYTAAYVRSAAVTVESGMTFIYLPLILK